MKVIIRSPKSEDYDRFSNIMDQVQQLHVEWRPDVYKPASPLITREAFEEILKKRTGSWRRRTAWWSVFWRLCGAMWKVLPR